jgi:hypothetical protein
LEHLLTQTITFQITEADFVVKINIFAPRFKFQTNFCIAHRFAWGWIFLRVGFDRIIGIHSSSEAIKIGAEHVVLAQMREYKFEKIIPSCQGDFRLKRDRHPL